MKTSVHFSTASVKIIAAGFAASSVLALAIPAFAHAASYAYVNQANEVSIVTANDAMSAIATAPNIGIHSGVMLLTSQSSVVVGSSI